jgi:hypothetical protein
MYIKAIGNSTFKKIYNKNSNSIETRLSTLRIILGCDATIGPKCHMQCLLLYTVSSDIKV